MVYSNAVLLARDRQFLADLLQKAGFVDAVEFHCDLDFTTAAYECVLFDEADEHIYMNPGKFADVTRVAPCICLTATSQDAKSGGFEASVLKTLGI